MSRSRTFRRAGPPMRLALFAGWALAGLVGSTSAQTIEKPPAPVVSAPAAVPAGTTIIEAPPAAPGAVEAPAEEAAPKLPDDIQVVRFQGPEGLKVEVLGPAPEVVPVGDGKGLATVGMKVGVGYKLRVSNFPDRPELEVFPTIEIVGHLHRPATIDPGKFPIRVNFSEDDLFAAAERGRLVTQVVYLEDPEQALPLKTAKDEPPTVMLNPAEEPLKVASALGRVMAIVRIGGRKPTTVELTQPLGDGLAANGCPFTTSAGTRCGLPCGFVCGTPPPANRRWLPRDEYLCDGGDRAMPLHFGGNGGLTGIDPRDAAVVFSDDKRPRVLPTNTVCIYAPRFASVRTIIGANESLTVLLLREAGDVQKTAMTAIKEGPKKINQNTASETNRSRMRASGLRGRVFAGENSELRVLSGYDNAIGLGANRLVQGAQNAINRQRIRQDISKAKPVTITRNAGAIVTGIVEGPGQMVMTWTPRETVGVETPPNRPGISVIKQVSTDQAEPGDIVTYTIRYKNMGNTPIKSVSIVDSLMPRLEYVPKTALGPKGTVFTAAENQSSSLELRWDLPGALAPGAEGYVEFQALVR